MRQKAGGCPVRELQDPQNSTFLGKASSKSTVSEKKVGFSFRLWFPQKNIICCFFNKKCWTKHGTKKTSNSNLVFSRPPKPPEPEVFDLWADDAKQRRKAPVPLPAPKMALPGHAESYNPPSEYLFTEVGTPMVDPETKEIYHIIYIQYIYCTVCIYIYCNYIFIQVDFCDWLMFCFGCWKCLDDLGSSEAMTWCSGT